MKYSKKKNDFVGQKNARKLCSISNRARSSYTSLTNITAVDNFRLESNISKTVCVGQWVVILVSFKEITVDRSEFWHFRESWNYEVKFVT